MDNLSISEIPLSTVSDILSTYFSNEGNMESLIGEYPNEVISLVLDFYLFPETPRKTYPVGSGKMIYPNPPSYLEGE